MSLIGLLFGEVEFSACGKDAARIFNLCMEQRLAYGKTVWDGERFRMSCRGHMAERLRAACAKESIELLVVRRWGLPYWLGRIFKRPGLMIGLGLAMLLLCMSRGVVMQIEIDGNENVSDERILALLASNGIRVGCAVDAIAGNVDESRILLSEPGLSWISIETSGNLVLVHVRESVRGEQKPKKPANLVALSDGLILRTEVTNGQTVVKRGDVVRKGDLLVSGIYAGSAGGEIRTARASGEVYAEVVHEYEIKIPLNYEKKVYTGRHFSKKMLKIFAKEIKVFANTGNAPPTCDIIYYENMFRVLGSPALPFGITNELHREYRMETVRLSEREAMELAFVSLENELSVLSARAELLSKEIDFELTEHEYILSCRLRVCENIAAVSEIDIS